MKTCCCCGQRKHPREYNKCSDRPDGLYSSCRVCSNARSRAHYEANKERYSIRVRAYEKAHKEQRNQRQRDRYKEDPEFRTQRILANKAFHDANPECRIRSEMRRTAELAESYVRKILGRSIGTKPSEVPEKLVEAKTIHLRVLRALKDMK